LKKVVFQPVVSLTKTILLFPYFMAILMLSHLFLSYFIVTELCFIPILPDTKNRAPILFVFYFIFNLFLSKTEQCSVFYYYFSQNILKNSLKNRLF